MMQPQRNSKLTSLQTLLAWRLHLKTIRAPCVIFQVFQFCSYWSKILITKNSPFSAFLDLCTCTALAHAQCCAIVDTIYFQNIPPPLKKLHLLSLYTPFTNSLWQQLNIFWSFLHVPLVAASPAQIYALHSLCAISHTAQCSQALPRWRRGQHLTPLHS